MRRNNEGQAVALAATTARRALVALACLVSACTEPAGPGERPDRIVVASSPNHLIGTRTEIWRMRPDGTEPENVTREPSDYSVLHATPDGIVVFAGQRNWPAGPSTDCSWRIWRMESDGSELRPITTGPVCSYNPRLAPGGTRVAYQRESEIFVANLDGSGEVHLTASLPPVPPSSCGAIPKVTIRLIGWERPDRVSFSRHVCMVGMTYFTVHVSGSDLREVPAGDPFDVRVSPDLSRVAFVQGGQVWVRNLDGTGLRTLGTGTFIGEYGLDRAPSPWSPDGARLLVTSGVQQHTSIRADGGDARIFATPERTLFAGWSPDGTLLAWQVYGTGTIAVQVSAADGSGFAPVPTPGTYNRYLTWARAR